MRHQHQHAKPQPGLEADRKAQEAANRIVVAERKRGFDETRKALDFLRKTRPQRGIGAPLEIPKHLQAPAAGGPFGHFENQRGKHGWSKVHHDE